MFVFVGTRTDFTLQSASYPAATSACLLCSAAHGACPCLLCSAAHGACPCLLCSAAHGACLCFPCLRSAAYGARLSRARYFHSNSPAYPMPSLPLLSTKSSSLPPTTLTFYDPRDPSSRHTSSTLPVHDSRNPSTCHPSSTLSLHDPRNPSSRHPSSTIPLYDPRYPSSGHPSSTIPFLDPRNRSRWISFLLSLLIFST